MSIGRVLPAVLASACAVAAADPGSAQRPSPTAPVEGYEVVRSYPHDRHAFTQGLIFVDDVLYEGTGLHGQSEVRRVRLETGEVLQRHRLDDKYFGEGIAAWEQTLIQLTWQSEVAFVYDRATLKPLETFTYSGEGWGLTHDGARLILSDGSATLRFLDPRSFREVGRLLVRDGTTPVPNLNELEFVRGEIFANVWQSDRIARISPKTGQVLGWVDLTGLLSPREAAGVDVLNGIAYDAAGDRLFVTGKLWPRLFHIRLTGRRAGAPSISSPDAPPFSRLAHGAWETRP